MMGVSTRDIMLMEESRVKEHILGLMALNMMDLGITIKYVAKELIYGQMEGNMMEIG